MPSDSIRSKRPKPPSPPPPGGFAYHRRMEERDNLRRELLPIAFHAWLDQGGPQTVFCPEDYIRCADEFVDQALPKLPKKASDD